MYLGNRSLVGSRSRVGFGGRGKDFGLGFKGNGELREGFG